MSSVLASKDVVSNMHVFSIRK